MKFLKVHSSVLQQGDWIFNFNMFFSAFYLAASVFPMPVTVPLYLCRGNYHLTGSHVGFSVFGICM